jgi:alpha-galactosidase
MVSPNLPLFEHASVVAKLAEASLFETHALRLNQTNEVGIRLRWEPQAEGVWQLSIEADVPIEVKQIELVSTIDSSNWASWTPNGYQGWTETRAFSPDHYIRPLQPIGKLIMTAYGDYGMYEPVGKVGHLHGYTWLMGKQKTGETALLASLNEDESYTFFRLAPNELRVRRDIVGTLLPNQQKVVFQLYTGLGSDESALFDEWQGHWHKLTPPKVQAGPPVTGWTSWYHYYTNISERLLLSVLDGLVEKQVPIDYFQIDDGWQPAVGDWLDPNVKFPHGMHHMAYRIHESGYKAGLWLAPFICTRESKIYREHPDWLLRDASGKPVAAGYNPGWSGWVKGYFYALDFRKPEVVAYLRRVFHRALHVWGFDILKVDFLYASCLVLAPGETYGSRMRDAMLLLRELAGDKQLLGCGVPLGPAHGLVEYCRIGSDVALTWTDPLLAWLRYRERVDTRNSLASTVGRRGFNRRFLGNDPDVYILRREKQALKPKEQYSLFLANLIFGQLVFTSDDVRSYDNASWALYRNQFPHRAKDILRCETNGWAHTVEFSIPDAVGQPAYFAMLNHGDTPMECTLPEGFYWYAPHVGTWVKGGTTIRLEPRQSRLWLKVTSIEGSIAGSGGHIFPGTEVAHLTLSTEPNTEHDTIEVILDPKASKRGSLWVKVPEDWTKVWVNGKACVAVQMPFGRGVEVAQSLLS